MAKYDELNRHLRAQRGERVMLGFIEIEKIIGAKLPSSARKYREWWSNERNGSHVQAHSWMEAWYEVEQVDFLREQVTFLRNSRER